MSEQRETLGQRMYLEYRFLFDFPSTGRLLAATAGLVPLLSISLTHIIGVVSIEALLKSLIILMLLAVAQGCVVSALQKIRGRKTLLRINRAMAFSLGSAIGFVFIMWLSRQLSGISLLLSRALEGYALGLSVGASAIQAYGMAVDDAKDVFVESLIVPTIVAFLDVLLFPNVRIFSIGVHEVLLAAYLTGILDLVAIKYALHIGGSSASFDATSALRGFLFTWFEGDSSLIEDALSAMSFERYLPFGIVRIRGRESGGELLLITSYAHPGPVLDIGSANMPYLLYEYFRQKGREAYVLHGTCSHGENLPSHKDVIAVAEAIEKAANEIKLTEEISTVLQEKIDDFTFTAQKFSRYILLIVTRSPKDFDDIALGIGIEIYGHITGKGYDGLLVDAHNSLSAPLAFEETKEGTEIGLKLVTGARKVVDLAVKLPTKDTKIGWARVPCQSLTIADGLGPGGVMSVVVEQEGKRFAYVIIDANNLGSGLREVILERLKERGLIDGGEVLTTDTHTVNARSPGRGAYPLLTMEHLDKLWVCVEASVNEAIKKLEPAEAGGKVIKVKTRIIGKENVERIVTAASATFRVFITALPLLNVLSVLLTAVILPLI